MEYHNFEQEHRRPTERIDRCLKEQGQKFQKQIPIADIHTEVCLLPYSEEVCKYSARINGYRLCLYEVLKHEI